MPLKPYRLLLVIIGVVCSLATSMLAQAQDSGELEYKPTDELLIVGDREMAPYEFMDDNGTPSGFTVDILNEILKRKGIDKFRVRMRQHAVALHRMRDGEADIMYMVYNVNPQDSMIITSIPLCQMHHVVVCDKNMGSIKVEDLKNYKVLLIDDTMLGETINNYVPEENRVYVDNVLDALRQVQTEAYDFAIMSNPSAQYYMSRNSFSDIVVRDIELPSYSVKIGVSANRPELLQIINEGIKELKADGTYDKIYQKWFGLTDVIHGNSYGNLLKYVIIIGGILLLSMIFVICYTMIQSGKIRKYSNIQSSKGKFYKNQASTLLDAVPVGVAIYSGSGQLKYVNSTLADMFNIRDKKGYVAAGHSIYENPLISDRNKLRIRKGEDFDFILTYNSDIDARYQYAYIPPEDSAYFECKVRHVKSDDETIGNSIYFVLHDVTSIQTARKELESQSNCLNLAIEVGNLCVRTCDIATSMIYTMFSNSPEKQMVLPLRDYIKSLHPDDLPTFLEVWDSLVSMREEEGNVKVRVMRDAKGEYDEVVIRLKVMYESSGRRSQTMRILMVSRM